MSPLLPNAFPLDTFQIDYLQAMINRAADALLCYRLVQANVATDALPCRPPRKPLRSHVFEPHSRAFEPHGSESHGCEPRSHVSKSRPHVFKPHVYERHSLGSTSSEPCLHVFKLHSFKPHPVGSLHFFDPDPAPPDPRLRIICLVLATLVV